MLHDTHSQSPAGLSRGIRFPEQKHPCFKRTNKPFTKHHNPTDGVHDQENDSCTKRLHIEINKEQDPWGKRTLLEIHQLNTENVSRCKPETKPMTPQFSRNIRMILMELLIRGRNGRVS